MSSVCTPDKLAPKYRSLCRSMSRLRAGNLKGMLVEAENQQCMVQMGNFGEDETTRHIRTHTGEKTYKCDIFQRSLSTKFIRSSFYVILKCMQIKLRKPTFSNVSITFSSNNILVAITEFVAG